MPQIPFVGGAYQDRSLNLSAQECQNLYPVIDQQGGNNIVALRNTPGLTQFCSPGWGEVRGMITMGDYLYAAISSSIVRFDSSGTFLTMTGSLNTTTGQVQMKHNGTHIMAIDGYYGYTLTGTTITQITDANFPVPSSLAYQDGYFIVTRKDTGQFFLSDSYDGTSWDAANYATAESSPDNLQGVVSANRELWLLGKESYEVWYNSGDTFPFDRISGATNKIGCCAPHSIADYQGVVAWMDENRFVRISSGYLTEKVSTPQIDYQFSSYTTVSDAISFIYSQEGHPFYVITFPTENKTWAYDFITKMWHTRASGADDDRHRANCHYLFNGKNMVGDYLNGKIYQYDLGAYTDNGTVLRHIRSAQTVENERKSLFHNALEVEFESGVGLTVDNADIGSGSNPKASLQWSDDGGHTWGNEHWVSIGKVGKYKTRAIWRRLGASRKRVYRLLVSDPVKCVIIGANLDAVSSV